LKLKCDEPPLNFAFNLNLRRYILKHEADVDVVAANGCSGTLLQFAAEAVRAGDPGGPELARLLIAAGAHLADSEKGRHQGIIDKLSVIDLTL
jgi:hypothetical protein